MNFLHSLKLICSLSLALLCLLSGCTSKKALNTPKVTVSIPPLRHLVQEIAKDRVDTVVLVPPGASPHTYEPSARQVLDASSSMIWLRVGEPFETRVYNVFRSHNPDMKIVDLREHINLISVSCCHHHHHHDMDMCDSHIWLSPRLLIQEVKDITLSLSDKFPEYKEEFQENSLKLISELTKLDRDFTVLFGEAAHKTILVSHPAFGYFSRDYGLEQLSIEVEGKDPTAKEISTLLTVAKEKNIETVFIQEQYNTKGAELIAQELGAKTMILDPYAENVVENLRTIARAFLQE